MIEDVVTTGKASMQTISCINEAGGNTVASASIIDRRNQFSKTFPCPFTSLIKLNIDVFTENDIPKHLHDIPITKPGSS